MILDVEELLVERERVVGKMQFIDFPLVPGFFVLAWLGFQL